MPSFTIEPKGSFSLAQSKTFLTGFVPATGTVGVGAASSDVTLAFRLDRTFEPVGVSLREEAGTVRGETFGAAPAAQVKKQAARMLGLDHDGTEFDALGERDQVIGGLQREFPGFRPVSFASPYEAAVWGVLAQRVSMKQAATLKKKLSIDHGDAVDVAGETIHVFPSPAKLLGMKRDERVADERWERLRGLSQAALDGLLDAHTLLSLPPEEALARLSALRGVGPWTAGHILLRGTGAVDLVSFEEPRVRRAVDFAYGAAASSEAKARAIVDGWKPYRTWAMVLVVFFMSRKGEWSIKGERGRGRSGAQPSRRRVNVKKVTGDAAPPKAR